MRPAVRCPQNTHLGLGYLNEVESYLYKTPSDEIHDDFRLWITAEPHPAFPIGLLQMGIKVRAPACCCLGFAGDLTLLFPCCFVLLRPALSFPLKVGFTLRHAFVCC